MTCDWASFDTAIAAAAGDDAALMAELRASYLASFGYQLDLLQRARCDANWATAAQRLQCLGASFHDRVLADLAVEALDGAPGDPVILRKMGQHVARFSAA